MIQALGATPVVTPFAEIVQAIRGGVVECAITGTLSGNVIGLHEVTSHVHAMAITWGISIFGANAAAWSALPAEVQAQIRDGVREMEDGHLGRRRPRDGRGPGLQCRPADLHGGPPRQHDGGSRLLLGR
jgi:TRAP-type C4-dicarboxylate transport system substrate-binding protein